MRKNLKLVISKILSNNQPMKLIDIVNNSKEFGYDSAHSYMAIYICLKENKYLFERVSRGTYRLREEKEARSILNLKIDPEEEFDEIYNYVDKNPNKTPAEIYNYLSKNGIYITYKSVCSHLSKTDFSRQLGVVTSKSYNNKYFTNK